MLRNDDRRLAHEVERKLGDLPSVNLWNLKVAVENGRVRLLGVASSDAEKQAALDAAAGVDGVVGVDDAIAVEAQGADRARNAT